MSVKIVVNAELQVFQLSVTPVPNLLVPVRRLPYDNSLYYPLILAIGLSVHCCIASSHKNTLDLESNRPIRRPRTADKHYRAA